ncbi:hypothetical protein [Mucilaginibacter sp.]|uniref:tetratricopeptide repeat protein n=1 Tax=Mucilaginibacter sp. TaxID=1882438 RepID=UPI0026110623|nr:hypothetical protein [Mucilaginibacter sp.]MDB4925012.1 hypothetical protein [Mucilaginibacter sp.]
MLKFSYLSLLLFGFSFNLRAVPTSVSQDSILTIVKLHDRDLQEKKLLVYLKSVFERCPVDSLHSSQIETDKLLSKYNIKNSTAIKYFIESVCQGRLLHLEKAESALARAIELASKNSDHYLLYAFFSQLAFLQSYMGNTIDAISSFRIANKEAIILKDPNLQVVIDINISDIYYRNNFYNQSLFYLNQALSIIKKHHIREQRLNNAIYYNKSENYFRMGNIDSLKKYNQILNNTKIGTFRLYMYKNRTNYYLSLLRHDYKNAINRIIELKNDPLYLYQFDNTDELNLANAYYYAGKSDSAKKSIERLLVKQEQKNHPEIKLHLFRMLGGIAENENNLQQAVYNLKMALQQSEDYIGRLTQVDTVTSQIKIDEMMGAYTQKEDAYKRERLWLIFSMVVALLIIIIGTMLYINTKQKRHYEKLLFTTQKEELAFINSHQVRRHLSNILGIIETMKHSKDKNEEYLLVEDHLLCAAENLDTAIKNISDKLNN